MIDNFAFEVLTGESDVMNALRRRIIRLSNYKYSVLISGSPGSGKSTVARAIHQLSDRRDRPFIPVDCSRLQGNLFQLQTFGHTGCATPISKSATQGCFGAGLNGTIFFKQINRLDAANQESLARVLSNRRFAKVGQTKTIQTTSRIMASSDSDLAAAVRGGRFRSDLYYQIGATQVQVADLTVRKDDIPALSLHFLSKCTVEHGLPFKELSPTALEVLQSYSWPGNVRELEEAIESAVISSPLDELMPHDFLPILFSDELLAKESLSELPDIDGKWKTLSEIEADHIRNTLRRTCNDIRETAQVLGLTELQLRTKMASHAINVGS